MAGIELCELRRLIVRGDAVEVGGWWRRGGLEGDACWRRGRCVGNGA
jgi:hypothetical protein